MKVFLIIRIALRALARNKTRSLLTTLGIIIGIAAVIAVVAVGQGASSMIKSQISTLGSNLITIFPGSSKSGGFHWGMGSQQNLTVDDAEAIARECPYVTAVTPVVRAGAQCVYREKDWATSIQGVDTSFQTVRNWDMAEGAFFTEADVRSATRVCVLGKTVAERLFEGQDPVGETVRVRGMSFRVLGVLAMKGTTAWGQDQDDTIVTPWTTVRRVLLRSPFNNVNQILISISSIKVLEEARRDITSLLRQRHRLGPGVDDDFSIMDITEVTQTITQVSRLMSALLAVIASVSLVVGGIGIMNIMLVSVTERTREIGLRMAVGARRRDILVQFLAEAVILSGIGGIFGIAAGAATAHVLARVNKWPVLISPGAVFIALLFSAAVGIFFGFYPAWRAARLNPIESLRYE